MIDIAASQLLGWWQQGVWPFFRLLALFGTAPFLSHPGVPKRVRVALAGVLTILLAPTLPVPPVVDVFSGAGFMLVFQQLAIGASVGWGLQIALSTLYLAGGIMGLQMGLGLAQAYDPSAGGSSALLGQFLAVIAGLLFFSVEGHILLLELLQASLFRIPPDPLHTLSGHGWWAAATMGRELFSGAMVLALPLVGLLLAANLALGIISRAAPSLHLFGIGFPALLMTGIGLLMLAIPMLGQAWLGQLRHLLDHPFWAAWVTHG